MAAWVVADVGSTFLKIGLFDGDDRSPLPQPRRVTMVHSLDGSLDAAAGEFADASSVWRVISVRRSAQERLAEWVSARIPHADFRVVAHADLPLKTNVEHPERVGVDRLAAAAAANVLRTPGRAAIVADSGTAITVDLLDPQGVFQGGAILPGVRLASRALHSQTDVLPEITLDPQAPPPAACGRNTRAALESGLFWGVVGAVRELIAELAKETPEPPEVFLSGGDGKLIATVLGPEARFVPHLALRGAALASRDAG
ncbi:MAG: type III pantothenate kinase [Planctomycetes bacterium]|nr:type III pantothenate kinase [Planctomycetota bacterium]